MKNNIIVITDGVWIKEVEADTGKTLTMKLTDDAYDKHFGIVNNLHVFLNNRGFRVSPKIAKALEFFTEDLYGNFAYLCGACQDKSTAEEIIKWMVGPLREVMNEYNITKPIDFKFTAPDFGELVVAIINKRITPTMGKDVLRMMADGNKLVEILELDKFKVASDDELLSIVETVIANNPQQVEKAKIDNKLIGWIVGQVMKASGGKVNAALAKELIEKKIL